MAKFRRKKTDAGERIKFALGIDDYDTKVGWFESAKYENGTPVASVAFTQEFGRMPVIPPRPFMRPTVSEQSGKWINTISGLGKRLVAGDSSPTQVMGAIGLMVQGDIAKKIVSIQEPPLAESTIKNRISKLANNKKVGNLTKPLVETGLMLASITHVVEEK